MTGPVKILVTMFHGSTAINEAPIRANLQDADTGPYGLRAASGGLAWLDTIIVSIHTVPDPCERGPQELLEIAEQHGADFSDIRAWIVIGSGTSCPVTGGAEMSPVTYSTKAGPRELWFANLGRAADAQSFRHAIGHCLGFGHATAFRFPNPFDPNGEISQYADPASYMGSHDGPLRLLQRELAGWILVPEGTLGTNVPPFKVRRAFDDWFYIERRGTSVDLLSTYLSGFLPQTRFIKTLILGEE
ncbi:MAG TPA: hypothetical protein VGC81_03340, partial [Candidatus Methylomirabilis sp.]